VVDVVDSASGVVGADSLCMRQALMVHECAYSNTSPLYGGKVVVPWQTCDSKPVESSTTAHCSFEDFWVSMSHCRNACVHTHESASLGTSALSSNTSTGQ